MRLTKLSLVDVLSVGCTSLSASSSFFVFIVCFFVCLFFCPSACISVVLSMYVDVMSTGNGSDAVAPRETEDVWCLCTVGNPAAVISFHVFTCSPLVLLPGLFCLLLFPLMAPSLGFFLCRKCMNTFCYEIRFFVWPLLGDDGWSVVCATCCHVTLVFAIMRLAFVYVHSK